MGLIELLKAEEKEAQKPIFLYVGDPMCSWCYGIGPEIKRVRERYEDAFNFELLMGGLRPYNEDVMNEGLKSELRSHWTEIASKTERKFNFDILDRDDFVYDSEPASRAVVVARAMKPEICFDFMEAVQLAFYENNQDTNELETYLELAANFDLDRREFWEKFSSEQFKAATNQEFQIARQLNVKSFPTLLMQIDEKWFVISRGFRQYEELRGIIEKTILLAEDD